MGSGKEMPPLLFPSPKRTGHRRRHKFLPTPPPLPWNNLGAAEKFLTGGKASPPPSLALDFPPSWLSILQQVVAGQQTRKVQTLL